MFDNLYFVGQTEYSAWAITTSDGIILMDAIFDYSVEDEVVGGLTALGLDPNQIKYVVISHAHGDHVGGAGFLQKRGARIVMSEADWDLMDAANVAYAKPSRDVVATDGQKLTLGDTTVTLHVTPGHTLGTLSSLIPVKDGGRQHVAAYWGGTAFNWVRGPANYITPDRPARFWFTQYATSAQRFRDLAARASADVLLSNHTNFDGSKAKIRGSSRASHARGWLTTSLCRRHGRRAAVSDRRRRMRPGGPGQHGRRQPVAPTIRERSAPALDLRPGGVGARRSGGRERTGHGPLAHVYLRLRQVLARRGQQLGELPAHH